MKFDGDFKNDDHFYPRLFCDGDVVTIDMYKGDGRSEKIHGNHRAGFWRNMAAKSSHVSPTIGRRIEKKSIPKSEVSKLNCC
jgi:hypothetical protein